MSDRYQEVDIIYFIQGVRICKCTDLQTGNTVCVKSLDIENVGDLSYLLREITSLYALNQSRFFVKILDYWLDGHNKSVEKLNIVTEFFKRGDLNKEILDRKKHLYYFKVSELKGHFQRLLDGFKALQEINYSHRDIKAENIFIDDEEQLVIGDLGSVSQKNEHELTLIGSHVYMSPEVRKNFMNFNAGLTGPKVFYNPIKSDVWSLGITFLYMITLEKPESLSNLINLENLIQIELNKVQNSIFKQLLERMLIPEPNDRDDFKTLSEWFSSEFDKIDQINQADQNSPKKNKKLAATGANFNFPNDLLDDFNSNCSVCNQEDLQIKCTKCKISAHMECLKDNFLKCGKCKTELDYKNHKLRCSECDKLFSGKGVCNKCKTRVCMNCQVMKTDCDSCFGFIFTHKKPEPFYELPIFSCPECKIGLALKGKTQTCQRHPRFRYCTVCKQAEHSGSCFNHDQHNQIYCLYCEKITEKLSKSFLIDCKHCNSHYCYVCLKGINEVSHIKCSNLYTWQ